MGLKDNLKFVKEEINQDEKLLASLIHLERWYKQYKIPLLIGAILVFVVAIGYNLNAFFEEKELQNQAMLYQKAIKDHDKQAIQTLKQKKSKLYDLYALNQALKSQDTTALQELKNSKDPIIAKLATYQYASLKADKQALQNASLLHLNALQVALLSLQEGQTQEALNLLSHIDDSSPLKEIATTLEHLAIKGIKHEK